MNIIANQEKLGTSKFDLWLFRFLYILSFKKSKKLKEHLVQIKKDLENERSKNMY